MKASSQESKAPRGLMVKGLQVNRGTCIDRSKIRVSCHIKIRGVLFYKQLQAG